MSNPAITILAAAAALRCPTVDAPAREGIFIDGADISDSTSNGADPFVACNVAFRLRPDGNLV